MMLAQKLGVEMGDKHLYIHRNGREISSLNICRGGSCNPIGVGIFATPDKRYGTIVCRSGEISVGNLFSLSFLWNI